MKIKVRLSILFMLAFAGALALSFGCEGGPSTTQTVLEGGDFSILNVDGTSIDSSNVAIDQALMLRVAGDAAGVSASWTCTDEFGDYSGNYAASVSPALSVTKAVYQTLQMSPETELPQTCDCNLNVKNNGEDILTWPFTTACGGSDAITNMKSLEECFDYYILVVNSFSMGVDFAQVTIEDIRSRFDTFEVEEVDGVKYLAVGGGETASDYELIPGVKAVAFYMGRPYAPGTDAVVDMKVLHDEIQTPFFSLTLFGSVGLNASKIMEENLVAINAKFTLSYDENMAAPWVQSINTSCAAGYMSNPMAELLFNFMNCMVMGVGCPAFGGGDEYWEGFGAFTLSDKSSWPVCSNDADNFTLGYEYASGTQRHSLTHNDNYFTFGGAQDVSIWDNTSEASVGFVYIFADVTTFLEDHLVEDFGAEYPSPTIYLNWTDVSGTPTY